MACITRGLVLAVALTLILGACGRKGSLENPPLTPEAKQEAAGKPPYRPFVLDPLVK